MINPEKKTPTAGFLSREFPVSRRARDRYQFRDSVFAVKENTALGDTRAARSLAFRINQVRRLAGEHKNQISAADVNAMGLIDEISRYVFGLYLEENGRDLVRELDQHLAEAVGQETIDAALEMYIDLFPPTCVYKGEIMKADYLELDDGRELGRHVALEEMLILWLTNMNPANRPLRELCDDSDLAAATRYRDVIGVIRRFFDRKPAFGPDDQVIIEMLRSPAVLYPDSLSAQLDFIRTRWGALLGKFVFRLLRSLDLINEEHTARLAGPGPTHVYRYSRTDGEEERFSPDKDWMPRVVLLAKTTLVWLSQLSRTYGRSIDRLDLIPDEELDRIASWGFTALWLIGIWERSPASKRIKRLCGNPDAEASAYSLLGYEIAESLGGWGALENLRDRCRARGIRLASDMVPNHTGIDSHWVVEHPDWFVQLPHSPFPNYTFTGENLSHNPGLGIYLEDHYYDRSDAAVAFKRVDFGSGEERFIYHGNDGTHMPWNDTAQLDFLKAEVREAVIETILHVARSFPIIRFDAAMTLAKKHIQRLWYPAPGAGGDIPSRSENGLPDDEFNARLPNEFWRDVVDRVAAEVPETLLLAEAFWMMEGYFVRTLGMHRVYNSAFMNMLKAEENAKYRETIKNTLEFDKDILKRFVNFMNNPDEETAIAQFGSGDKYIGVCTMMVTMPGLPMFGHGQIEGFTEKYGMEFSRAYLDETPNAELVERHEAEIFPLLKKRHVFADVERFFLYDLVGDDGSARENVFVYSNSTGTEHALIAYNNAYERAWGWVHTSVEFVEKDSAGGRAHRRDHLGTALGLTDDYRRFCLLREQRTGLWYIRNSHEIFERGFFLNLDGYRSQVFLDIYEVVDTEEAYYARLADSLAGAGTPNIADAVREVAYKPLYDSLFSFANSALIRRLAGIVTEDEQLTRDDEDALVAKYRDFLVVALQHTISDALPDEVAEQFRLLLRGLIAVPLLKLAKPPKELATAFKRALSKFFVKLKEDSAVSYMLATYVLVAPLHTVFCSGDPEGCFASDGITEEWALHTHFARIMPAVPESDPEVWRELFTILIRHGGWFADRDAVKSDRILASSAITRFFSDPTVTSFLAFNRYDGVEWFNKERCSAFLWWMYATSFLSILPRPEAAADVVRTHVCYAMWDAALKGSAYQTERFLTLLSPPITPDDESPAIEAAIAESTDARETGDKRGAKKTQNKKTEARDNRKQQE